MSDDEINAKTKKSGGQKLRDCCNFFYNSEEGTVLGRTGKSWGLILIFYLVFYGVLAGFFAICLIGFFKTMDDNAPTQQYMYSLLKQNPGMGFRPKPEIVSTLIKFSVNESETYEKYVQNLDEYLAMYTSSDVPNDAVDCSAGERSTDEICLFPLSNLGDRCTKENQYGYAEGKPCVLLKMNKVYGWEPQPFENGTDAEAVATKHLEGRMDDNYVGVSCVGEIDSDLDSIKSVSYYPNNGFEYVYFPYFNQKGYLPPVVMAQFNVVPGRLVMIWCRAWAKNIKHHKGDRQGSVHFELLVESA